MPEIKYDKKTWKEFRETGLLWFINRIIQLFGWVIVVAEGQKNGIYYAYPARTNARGFSEQTETKNFLKLSNYMKDNAEELFTEQIEESEW